MSIQRSQGKKNGKVFEDERICPKYGLENDIRQRAYAFLVYLDSSYPDWMERLDAEHISALVSPLHNADKNPDGSDKKEHWHVMLMFEGKKSLKQINEIRERVLGPDYNPALENVGSLRGYARYMIHADNPEKVAYDRADVRMFGGADYEAITMLPGDDVKMIADIMKYIRANGVEYYSDFMLMCEANKPEWFNMLVHRKSYVIVSFFKAEAAKRKALVEGIRDVRKIEKDEHEVRERYGKIDLVTGEVVEDRNI